LPSSSSGPTSEVTLGSEAHDDDDDDDDDGKEAAVGFDIILAAAATDPDPDPDPDPPSNLRCCMPYAGGSDIALVVGPILISTGGPLSPSSRDRDARDRDVPSRASNGPNDDDVAVTAFRDRDSPLSCIIFLKTPTRQPRAP
jgi:hypothetical protein